MIIPKGFTEQVKQHKKADVGYVQRMTSLATMSNTNTGSDTALAVIQQAVKSTIYQDKLSSGAMTEDEMNQLEDPVLLSETTVVGDKADKVSSSVVMSLCSAQSMVVPIIMFVLIMFSAQTRPLKRFFPHLFQDFQSLRQKCLPQVLLRLCRLWSICSA